MTKVEKSAILQKKAIAYYSGCGGIEIKEIEYSINDSVLFVAGAWTANKSVHKARIYSNNTHDYFIFHGYRIPLDECLRV